MALFARLFVAACAAIALAGCVTPRNISLQDARSLKAVVVEVKMLENATVTWNDGLWRYAEAKGIAPGEDGRFGDKLDGPEVQAWVKREAIARVSGPIQTKIKAGLQGSRPVRVVVTIRGISELGVGARMVSAILIGDQPPRVGSEIVISDMATGREIERWSHVTTLGGPTGGIAGAIVIAGIESAQSQSAIDRLGSRHADDFLAWLLRE